MKKLCLTTGVLVLMMLIGSGSARAQLVSGTITEIQVAEDKVVVFGNFFPATGCTINNAVFLVAGDAFFKEIYALLLSAKISGLPIKYFHVYCHSLGYSRGNTFSITQP